MTPRLLIFIALAASGIFAQTPAERLKAAEQELAILTLQVSKLTPQPKPTRSMPVRPNPSAAQLARKIAEFATLNEDLPLIRRTRLILADAQEAAGDPAGAITEREKLCADNLKDGGAKALLQAATARLTWGDPSGALKGLKRLQAAAGRTVPMPSPELMAQAEKSAALFEEQLEVIVSGLKKGGRGSAAAWVGARRFIGTWPLAPQCQQLIDGILKKLKAAKFEAREGYLRHVAVFFPVHKQWATWALQIVQADRTEGNYDSAITLGLRLLSRSETLPPREVDALRNDVTQAERLNAQIAARKLTLRPLTCTSRYNDIIAQMQTATAIEDVLTLEEEFAMDYPKSSKVPALRMAVALAAAEPFPDEAITRLKKVASNPEGGRQSHQAALMALPLITQQESEESAKQFIAECVQRATKPADKAALVLAHCQLLEKDDRPDEALQMLEAHAESLGTAVAKRLAQAIKRLKQ